MQFSRRIFLLLAAAILSDQLFVPPVVALANNGDFVKVLGRFNLYPRQNRTYLFADAVYEFHPERHWVSGFYSTEIPIAQAAIWLNSLVSKDGNFDIRLIGFVHGALFFAALWLFAPLLADARPLTRNILYALILLVFCDPLYVSGLNSFYMDEPAYLFLLLGSVAYLRLLRWHRRSDLALTLASAFLLAGSKTQHAALGVWIAVLLFVSRKSIWPKARNPLRYAAPCLALFSILMLWKGAPGDYAVRSIFTVVFKQILPQSRDLPRTLAALGLDDSYRHYLGKNAYDQGSRMEEPAFREAFQRRVTLTRLGAFYFAHPGDAYQVLRASLSQAGQRRGSLGNFDVSAGLPPRAISRAFSLWSGLNRRIVAERGSRLVLEALGAAVLLLGLVFAERRALPRGAVSAALALAAMTFTEMAISSLADFMDIERHHLLFFALLDMMVLYAAYLGGRRIINRIGAPPAWFHRSERSGANRFQLHANDDARHPAGRY